LILGSHESFSKLTELRPKRPLGCARQAADLVELETSGPSHVAVELPAHLLTGKSMSSISRFLRSESGATTAEYGIIIVVVAGIAIFVLSQLNGALSTLYDKFNGKVSTVS
jgi:Flp pilus assembly pilin Flp